MMKACQQLLIGLLESWKVKSIKKMTAPDSKSYLNYLDRFVDKYNKTYIALLVRNLYLLTNLLCLKNLDKIKQLLNSCWS